MSLHTQSESADDTVDDTMDWPEISEAERLQHESLFFSQGPLNGVLSGERIRDLFLHSGLPLTSLSRLWNLADVTNDNLLSVEEFCLLMHLTQCHLRGVKIPTTLPPSLHPAPMTNIQLPVISDQQKTLCQEAFKSQLQKGDTKHLSGSGLKPLLLRQIWHLADLDKDGLLCAEEWEVFCHLVKFVKQGKSIEGAVNVYSCIPEKTSPFSLQAQRLRFTTPTDFRVSRFHRDKAILSAWKERRKEECLREMKRHEIQLQKIALIEKLLEVLKDISPNSDHTVTVQKNLQHEREKLRKQEKIVIRLRREHEKVREETVKAIVTEQKLQEDEKQIKLETEDIARRLSTPYRKSTKDPDPFHQIHEERKELRKKGVRFCDPDVPKVHVPFVFSPFDRDRLKTQQEDLPKTETFSDCDITNLDRSKLKEAQEFWDKVTSLSDLPITPTSILPSPTTTPTSPDKMGSKRWAFSAELEPITEEDAVFKTVPVLMDEEFWFAPYLTLDGSNNQHMIDLHKKLLDLKLEVEKLNRHGGQLVFRNPADYEANLLPKHSGSRTDRARHYREKLLDNAARRHTSPAGNRDSGEENPSKKAAREYRIKRRSLNLEQQKVLGESVAGSTVRGGSAENVRSPRSSPRASPLASPRTKRIVSWKAGRLLSLGDSSSIQRTSRHKTDSLDKDQLETSSKNTGVVEQALSRKDNSIFARESLATSDDHKQSSEDQLINQEQTNLDESSHSNPVISVPGLLFEDISGSETSSGISVICDTSTSISQPLSPVDSGSVFDADKSDALDDLVFLDEVTPKEESQTKDDTRDIDLGYSTLKEYSLTVNKGKLTNESESHVKTSGNIEIESTSVQPEDLEGQYPIETQGFDSDIDSGNNSGSETPPPLPDSAPPQSESQTPGPSTLPVSTLPESLSESSTQPKVPEKTTLSREPSQPAAKFHQQSSTPENTSQSTFTRKSLQQPSQPTLPEKLSKPVIPEKFSETTLQTFSQKSSQDNQEAASQPVLLIDSHQLTSDDSFQTTLPTREKTNPLSSSDLGPTSLQETQKINLADTNCPPPLPNTAPPLPCLQTTLPCVKGTSVLVEKVEQCSDTELDSRDIFIEENNSNLKEKSEDCGKFTDCHLLKEGNSSSNSTGCEASANCDTHSVIDKRVTDIKVEQRIDSGASQTSIAVNHCEDTGRQNYKSAITESKIPVSQNQQPEIDFSFKSKQEVSGDSGQTKISMEGSIGVGLGEEVVVAEHRSRQYTLPQDFIPVEDASAPHPIPPPRRRSKTDKQRKSQSAAQESWTADKQTKPHPKQENKAEEVIEEEIVMLKRESTESVVQIDNLLNSLDASKITSGGEENFSDSDVSDDDGRGNSSQNFQLNQTDTSNMLPDFSEDSPDDGITLVCYETKPESLMVSEKLSTKDNLADFEQMTLANEVELTPAVNKVNMCEAMSPTRNKGEESLERGRDFAEKVQPKYVIRKQSSGGSSHNLSSEDLQEMLQERQAVINQTAVLRRTTDWSDWKRDDPADPSEVEADSINKDATLYQWENKIAEETTVSPSERKVSVSGEGLPSKINLYSENVIRESDTTEEVDREPIANIANTKKHWENLFQENILQKGDEIKPRGTVRHWEVKIHKYEKHAVNVENNNNNMDTEMYENESAIEREIRLALEREELLKREKEAANAGRRESVDKVERGVVAEHEAPVHASYEEMTEVDRAAEMLRRRVMADLEPLQPSEDHDYMNLEDRRLSNTSSQDSGSDNRNGVYMNESIVEREIREATEREEERRRERANHRSTSRGSISDKPDIVVITSAEESTDGMERVRECDSPKLTYESAVSQPDHAGESLIARELRETREREEELRRLRQQMYANPSPNSAKSSVSPSAGTTGKAVQNGHSGTDGQARPGSWQRDVSPYVSNHKRNSSVDSVASSQSSTRGGSATASDPPSAREKIVKVHPMVPNTSSEDSKKSYEPCSETPIEREIRLAREREDDFRRAKGLPVADRKAEQPHIVEPSKPTNSVRSVHLPSDNSTLKRLTNNRLKQEIRKEIEREETLRKEGKISTTSDQRIGQPMKYVEVKDETDGAPKRNFLIKKREVSSSKLETPHKNGSVTPPSPAAPSSNTNKRSSLGGSATFSYKETRQKAESKIEQELREMREREEELKKQRANAASQPSQVEPSR
ncbi:LOW QUALITY PROTEIN: uncharacterized protein LOC135470815 [Liolophura sinensis]|uniref:LOW QUALITY PROTEIN: uncharacterized protein LOC135470815 n=1 Tax=Liolophura sinensis TaxID=3198878 RepID=UPI003159958E